MFFASISHFRFVELFNPPPPLSSKIYAFFHLFCYPLKISLYILRYKYYEKQCPQGPQKISAIKSLKIPILGGKTVKNVQIDPQTMETWATKLNMTLWVREWVCDIYLIIEIWYPKNAVFKILLLTIISIDFTSTVINCNGHVVINW